MIFIGGKQLLVESKMIEIYEKIKQIHQSMVFWLSEIQQLTNGDQYRALNMIQNQIKDLEDDIKYEIGIK